MNFPTAHVLVTDERALSSREVYWSSARTQGNKGISTRSQPDGIWVHFIEGSSGSIKHELMESSRQKTPLQSSLWASIHPWKSSHSLFSCASAAPTYPSKVCARRRNHQIRFHDVIVSVIRDNAMRCHCWCCDTDANEGRFLNTF